MGDGREGVRTSALGVCSRHSALRAPSAQRIHAHPTRAPAASSSRRACRCERKSRLTRRHHGARRRGRAVRQQLGRLLGGILLKRTECRVLVGVGARAQRDEARAREHQKLCVQFQASEPGSLRGTQAFPQGPQDFYTLHASTSPFPRPLSGQKCLLHQKVPKRKGNEPEIPSVRGDGGPSHLLAGERSRCGVSVRMCI